MVAPQPFYRDRGTPIALRQVLRALSELGHRVDLLTYPLGSEVDLPGLSIHRCGRWLPVRDVPIGLSGGKLLLDVSLTAALVRRVSARRYDVVHAAEESAFPAAFLCARRSVPLIYDMQSNLPEQLESHRLLGRPSVQRRLRAAEVWLVRRSSAIACSAGLAARVRAIAPDANVREWWFAPQSSAVSGERVRALRAKLELPRTSRIVLYTGNFAPYQGVTLLLEAATEVRREVPEAVFVLVGASAEETPDLPAGLEALRDSGVVRLVGRRPREEMPVYLAAAEVLVSPRREGANLPLKIFDYLESGKPIVATDIATHRTLLDEERAILVAPSARELAASISMVLRDPEAARRIGGAARRWAERHLGWESFRDRVASLYHSAVGRASRSPIRAADDR
jgi:glycosyltransferase involved in cell wall biosynthesis